MLYNVDVVAGDMSTTAQQACASTCILLAALAHGFGRPQQVEANIAARHAKEGGLQTDLTEEQQLARQNVTSAYRRCLALLEQHTEQALEGL